MTAVEPFPRSARYDPAWDEQCRMGPNVLWLCEALCSKLTLRPGMRVLDLGCGRAASSIFLAREYGLRVFANDLWISPTENLARIVEAGLEAEITPIRAEGHELPYAHGYFDVIVSLDAYHYFGTDDLYLESVLRFLRPGGELGIVCPGVARELTPDQVPAHLRDLWRAGWHSFHSAEWWGLHWAKTELVDVTNAEALPDSHAIWQEFAEHTTEAERAAIQADRGEFLTFARTVATKR